MQNFRTPKKISKSKEILKLKIAVIGKSLVGKSAITNVFVSSKFIAEYDTTIEDKYTVERFISNYPCSIDILDTAGQDDYYTLIDNWINSSDGFILTFSIIDRESFEICKSRYDRIKLNKGNNFRIILAGNKSDMKDNRTVSIDEAKELAESWNTEYLECSAKNMINVEEIFINLSEKLLNKILKKDISKGSNENYSDEKKPNCYCF